MSSERFSGGFASLGLLFAFTTGCSLAGGGGGASSASSSADASASPKATCDAGYGGDVVAKVEITREGKAPVSLSISSDGGIVFEGTGRTMKILALGEAQITKFKSAVELASAARTSKVERNICQEGQTGMTTSIVYSIKGEGGFEPALTIGGCTIATYIGAPESEVVQKLLASSQKLDGVSRIAEKFLSLPVGLSLPKLPDLGRQAVSYVQTRVSSLLDSGDVVLKSDGRVLIASTSSAEAQLSCELTSLVAPYAAP